MSAYLRRHLENYMDYEEFEKWFGIKKCLTPLSKIDELFDISDNENLFTIGLICNPYMRVWLNYIMTIDVTDASTEGLRDFIFNGIHDHPDYTTNCVTIYNHKNHKVNFLLDFSNISEDLKKIDELSNRTDTNIFDNFYEVANKYSDFYTEELRQEVYNLFKEDFTFYGFNTI